MLRNFEQDFSGFSTKTEEDGKLDKLKDIDSAKLDNFEQKIWDIWIDNKIDRQIRYEKIFLIFFKSFCNKLGKKSSVDADTGQWVQGRLERLSIMGIPVDVLLRSTTTLLTPPGTEEQKQLFNKEVSGRIVGAQSTSRYVDNRVKDKNINIRLLINDEYDKKYATDLIEVCGEKDSIIESLFITQVKTKERFSKEEIESIHKQHQDLFDRFKINEKQFEENIQTEKEQFEKMKLKVFGEFDDIQIIVSEILEKNPGLDSESLFEKVSSNLQITPEQLHSALLEINPNDEDLFEEMAILINYLKTKPEPRIFKPVEHAIIPSRCRKVISKISNGDQLISQKPLQ